MVHIQLPQSHRVMDLIECMMNASLITIYIHARQIIITKKALLISPVPMCPHLHHLFEAFYRWNLGNEEYFSYVKMPIGRSRGNTTQYKKVYNSSHLAQCI